MGPTWIWPSKEDLDLHYRLSLANAESETRSGNKQRMTDRCNEYLRLYSSSLTMTCYLIWAVCLIFGILAVIHIQLFWDNNPLIHVGFWSPYIFNGRTAISFELKGRKLIPADMKASWASCPSLSIGKINVYVDNRRSVSSLIQTWMESRTTKRCGYL